VFFNFNLVAFNLGKIQSVKFSIISKLILSIKHPTLVKIWLSTFKLNICRSAVHITYNTYTIMSSLQLAFFGKLSIQKFITWLYFLVFWFISVNFIGQQFISTDLSGLMHFIYERLIDLCKVNWFMYSKLIYVQ